MNGLMKMAAISVIVAAAGAANAGFTTVQTGGVKGGGGGGVSDEANLNSFGGVSVVHIFAKIYGNTFNVDQSNAAIDAAVGGTGVQGTLTINGWTATRLHDNGGSGGSMQLGTGVGANDQVWVDGTVSASAYARFAGDKQAFGWQTGAANSSLGFTGGPIVQTQTQGFQTAGGGLVSVGPGNFRWIRATPGDNNFDANTGNDTFSRFHSSLESENSGNDMMIAFRVTKAGEQDRYLLLFEDRFQSEGGDRDFNDFVIELVVIPLPTGAAMGMAGMGLLAIRRRSAR